jgi:hypothetical protein
MSTEYLTIDELRAAPYSITEAQSGEPELTILLGVTKSMVDGACNQTFSKEGSEESPVEKKVNGTGGESVFAPKRLVTLTSVYVYSSLDNYVEYDADQFIATERRVGFHSFTDISARLLVNDFPEGKSNIGILGVWGWAAVPDPIKYLQGSLIRNKVVDGDFVSHMKSEKIGDYTYTRRDDPAGQVLYFGDAMLDEIVRQYQWFELPAAV